MGLVRVYCISFNDISNSDHITSNDWMTVHNELESMQKEVAVA
jgi:hypothetical protein